jgi:hypothetical protein
MSINGVSYIGYRISGDFFTIREVIINSTMIEDARRIFVFRLITGLTFNEKKIIIRGGRAISWGEVRMRKTRRFVPELIERKWFSDISVSMFTNGITEIFDPLFRKRIENVISRINPNLIYLSDTIETNICSFLT